MHVSSSLFVFNSVCQVFLQHYLLNRIVTVSVYVYILEDALNILSLVYSLFGHPVRYLLFWLNQIAKKLLKYEI